MGERTCVICDARLSGRQTKYCGQRCVNKANDIRKRQLPGFAVRRKQYQRAWMDRTGRTSKRSPTKACVGCGATGVLYSSKYCSRQCAGAHRPTRPPTSHPCKRCGSSTTGKRVYCSTSCRSDAQREHAISQWGPLRIAIESNDWPAVETELLGRTTLVGDCRRWTGRVRARKSRGGAYGSVAVGKKTLAVHRLMAQAARGGADLGHMPVHHTCGNSWCINPDHLQVVTPHENTAEMLERTHYLARIHALESALAAVAPQHPILRT